MPKQQCRTPVHLNVKTVPTGQSLLSVIGQTQMPSADRFGGLAQADGLEPSEMAAPWPMMWGAPLSTAQNNGAPGCPCHTADHLPN